MNSDLLPLSEEAQSIQKGLYEHFKGGRYQVLGVARHSEDPGDEYVVYEHDGNIWVRPVKMFLETVEINGQKMPRFKLVEGQN